MDLVIAYLILNLADRVCGRRDGPAGGVGGSGWCGAGPILTDRSKSGLTFDSLIDSTHDRRAGGADPPMSQTHSGFQSRRAIRLAQTLRSTRGMEIRAN